MSRLGFDRRADGVSVSLVTVARNLAYPASKILRHRDLRIVNWLQPWEITGTSKPARPPVTPELVLFRRMYGQFELELAPIVPDQLDARLRGAGRWFEHVVPSLYALPRRVRARLEM